MNERYKEIATIEIKKFINNYKSAKEIFKDLNKQNNLIHPGEMGKFREEICKELIDFAIPQKFEISTGFLINSFNEVSTQCDLIIYDLNNTPLIKNNNTKFFPVESTIAIGEIKSDLTIKELCDALLTLSKIKKLKKIKDPFNIDPLCLMKFDPKKNPSDTFFTFLICNSIKFFDFNKVNDAILKSYDNHNIEFYLRHNIILSLNDGVITYNNQFDDLHKSIPKNQKMYCPIGLRREFEGWHFNKNKVEDIIYFLSSLTNFLINVQIYYPDPVRYF